MKSLNNQRKGDRLYRYTPIIIKINTAIKISTADLFSSMF